MPGPKPLRQVLGGMLLKSFQTRCVHSPGETSDPASGLKKKKKWKKTPRNRCGIGIAVKWPLSLSAETVTISRDTQDTISGEPPGDIITKDPFQDMTGQPFTFDYTESTHVPASDEEGSENITVVSFLHYLRHLISVFYLVVFRRAGSRCHHSHRYSGVPGSVRPSGPHHHHTQKVYRFLKLTVRSACLFVSVCVRVCLFNSDSVSVWPLLSRPGGGSL